ncbi:MAG: EutP/PduV family microcompartment system protein [Deltaproteobacteria bacterium]|nr:EutP/PduV family microcompartment system protein [Deltaproteobacteria bacterium]
MPAAARSPDGPRAPLMVIGPVASGKSTLLAALGLGPGGIKKTEALTYNGGMSIDTPGEMLAIPRFYNALILNSGRASVVLLLMDGRKPMWLPAKICLALRARVAGVVTKTDVAEPGGLGRAETALTAAGVDKIFKISSVTGQGLEELREWLAANGCALPDQNAGDGGGDGQNAGDDPDVDN